MQLPTGCASRWAGIGFRSQYCGLNVFAILNEVVAASVAVGLTEVEQPSITTGTKVKPFCAEPDEQLFWDGIHQTCAGHRILAQRASVALDALTRHVSH